MNPPYLSTRFAGLPARLALLVLAWTAVGIGWCLYVSLSDVGLASGRGYESFKDQYFWADVMESIRAGRGYYENETLPPLFVKYHYTTFSVFNFRTPFYAYAIGRLPSLTWGKVHVNLMSLLAVTAVVLGTRVLAREGGAAVVFPGLLLLIGVFGWGFIGPAYLFAELGAGTLIALSVCFYALGRWPLAVLAGMVALFVRELSLPYCLIALGFALWQRRRAEAVAWVGGFLLYGAFMVWHVQQVRPLLATTEGEGFSHWLRFGGATFLLETCQVNFLQSFLLPWWASAFYLPLAVLGLAAWPGETGLRAGLTVLVYLAAFSVVGGWFNAYWGLMIAPLLALGLSWAPLALRDLFGARRAGRTGVEQVSNLLV